MLFLHIKIPDFVVNSTDSLCLFKGVLDGQ